VPLFLGLANLFGVTRSNSLERVLISAQDRGMVGAKRDMDQVVAHFSSFGDSVNLDIRWVHGLREMCNRFRNCFGHNRWNSYVKWVK
jgi:hypothetical protein